MKALLFTSLGFSTISSDRQKTTQLCRGPVGSSDILIRFTKHDFRVKNSYVSWESLSIGPRALKQLGRAQHQINLLWSRGCQVSVEWDVVASELNLDRGHGRLRQAWDLVPNDLLSVSRSSRSRTPNAVCVAERSRQPRAKRTHLFFGSA